MKKAVLVIDMPKNCKECKLMVYDDISYWCPVRTMNDIFYETDVYQYVKNETKPDWCPLKEIPEKKEIFNNCDDYLNGVDDGWNACIDEILGE